MYGEEVGEKPSGDISDSGFEGSAAGDEGELLEEAVDTVQAAGKASASLLQRRLRVGYARAARLLDILEDKGIIGPGEGAKPREVYGANALKEEGYGEASEADEFEKAQKGDYK